MFLSQQRCTKLSHNLPDLYRTGDFSDTTLQFFQCNSPDHDTQSPPVMEIRSHRNILSVCTADALKRLVDRRYGLDREGMVIRVELDFRCYSEEIVRFFFSLLYYNKLNASILSPNHYENIMQLHQLSIYFQFRALSDLCLGIIYSLFSLDHFSMLVEYCHSPNCESVSNEKVSLYTKLIHWNQLCHTSMTENNKENIYFQLPGRSILIQGGNIRLYHYRRLCHQCLSNGRHIIGDDLCIVDMGYLELCHNDRVRWNFSMTHKKGDLSNMVLYIKQLQSLQLPPPSTDDHMSVETIHLKSRVSLFSKLIDDPIITTESEIDSLGTITQLAQLSLHDTRECYESQCDSCQRKSADVFIFCITVEIQR